LVASADGYVAGSKTLPGVVCDDQMGKNFELMPTSSTAELVGFVVDKLDADPLAGVDLLLFDARNGFPSAPIMTTNTDAFGYYDFGGVDLLNFNGPEPVSVELCADGSGLGYEFMCETFHLSRGQDAQQDFQLRSLVCTGQIKKHVIDADSLLPIGGIVVELVDSDGNTVGVEETTSAGLADFYSVPEGDYTIRTHSDEYCPAEEEVTLECGQMLNVTNELEKCYQDLEGSTLSIKEGIAKEGILIFADEDCDNELDEGEISVESDEFGLFTLTLPAGDIPYDVCIGVDTWYDTGIDGVLAQEYNLWEPGKPWEEQDHLIGPIEIVWDSEHTPIEIELICKNVLVKYYRNSTTDAAIPGLEVTASIVDNPWFGPDPDGFPKTATTDGDGKAVFTDIPADSLVMLEVGPDSAPGFVGPWVSFVKFGEWEEGDPGGTIYFGQCDWIVEEWNYLDSEAQIVGYVFDDFDGDGTPGPDPGEFNQDGIRVYLKYCDACGDTQVAFVDTGDNGWFAFTGLQPGVYQLVVDGEISECFVLGADDKDRLDFDNLNNTWYERGPEPPDVNGGNLDGGDPTFDRPGTGDPCTLAGGTFYYDDWGRWLKGPVMIDLIGNTLTDPFLALYGDFDDTAGCDTLVQADDDGAPTPLDSRICFQWGELPEDGYDIVATSYGDSGTGTYDLNIYR
jgi:hypothetical protein